VVLILIGVLLIIPLNNLVNALNITIISPYEGQNFTLPHDTPGKYIDVNISTDEEATCLVIPGICQDGGMIGVCLYFYPQNLSTEDGKNHSMSLFVQEYLGYPKQVLDFECKDTSNQTFYNETFFSVEHEACTPNLENTSWSEWENDFPCGINNKVDQIRFFIQYDTENCGIIPNQTFYEHRENYCDYCSQNITGPFYNNWSECNEYGIRNRRGYYIDLNFESCCEVTNFPEDCGIKNDFRNFTEEEDCNLSLNIFVKEPSRSLYESRRIDFDINSTIQLEILELIDYFGDNEWDGLCEDCKSHQGSRIFRDGKHNLTIRGRNDGKEAFAFVSFLVDTKNPVIHTMNPRGNRFTNGSNFYVQYTEENCKSVLLEVFGFGGIGNKTASREPCKSGRSKNESFSLNLTDFNNQEVSYQFTVYDISEKKTRSRFIKVRVDTTPPKINNPHNMINRTARSYAYLKINITEINLDKVEYKDLNDPRARWRTACTRLREDICERRIRLTGYSPKLAIRVLDEAGNSDYAEV